MRYGLTILACVAASGCSHTFRVKDFITTESLMEASKTEFRHGHFLHAQAGFQRVNFEVSATDSVGAVSRYLLAECDFGIGNYLEASRGFRRVADDYPDHPLAPDALLRAGDALTALWGRPELDPTYGEEALAAYRELAARYPEGRATERSRLKLSALSNRFAEKEYRAGIFYFRLKAYDSAIIYFRSVAAQWGETPAAPNALMMLVRTYQKLEYKEETQETCAHLRQYYANAKGLNQVCAPVPAAP
ncbi:MAG: outer membrane protein assembly factor BamD [Gemmatimonadetes bacterium]|nr:outer membrane protein assembly factor BamD [Gemmatimonadota bacterium]